MNFDLHPQGSPCKSTDSIETLKHAPRRNWVVTLDQGPNGEVRPTGFVADDGMVIQHGTY